MSMTGQIGVTVTRNIATVILPGNNDASTTFPDQFGATVCLPKRMVPLCPKNQQAVRTLNASWICINKDAPMYVAY